ncbi:uncharacterized protein LOC123409695 [Hordeum vulgare subsp. vulgare]|uniref:uncharacterized protein LOC123409695 n=1 Tax=Hordeum vulgare subsp. vulgare TaxID=112509 RepID=UPI001D1A34BC|nr:uncharacterized protein LOC123409695 [Hordeum vulgare subsp. vulgare]
MCQRRGADGPEELPASLSKMSSCTTIGVGRRILRLVLDKEAPVSTFMARAPTGEGRCILNPKLGAEAPMAAISCARVGDGRRGESGCAGSAGSEGVAGSTSSWTS